RRDARGHHSRHRRARRPRRRARTGRFLQIFPGGNGFSRGRGPGGRFELAASYKYFPAGTVFLVVVDPGVGSKRRGLAAEAGEYRFVAPDNGVLTAVLEEAPPKKMVKLTEPTHCD